MTITASTPGDVDPAWRPAFLLAAVAAVIVVALIPLQAAVFLLFPPPQTAPEYLRLFQQNPVQGLVDLDLLLTLDYLVMVPLYLALFASTVRTSRTWASLGLISGLFSLVLYLFSREATFSMWMLSSQYAAARTPAERTALLGAAQTLLTQYDGGTFGLSYLLGAVSTLVFSIVLLRRRTLGSAVAVVGIVTGATMLVPANAGAVGVVIALLSLIPTAVWLILLCRAFVRLGRRLRQEASGPGAGSTPQTVPEEATR